MNDPIILTIPTAPVISPRSFIPAPDIEWREFNRFPKLPPELRLKIWAYALPDPRIMTIESVPPRTKDYLISCKDRIPSTLLVNRESREAALKRYSLCFLTFENVYGPPVYFDFGRDIVCVSKCGNDWWTDFNDEFNKGLSLVKRVIVRHRIARSSGGFISRTTPFYDLESLGLAIHVVDLPLTFTQQWQLFYNIARQILRAKDGSGNPGETDANLLMAAQIYFLSWDDVTDLKIGEILLSLGQFFLCTYGEVSTLPPPVFTSTPISVRSFSHVTMTAIASRRHTSGRT